MKKTFLLLLVTVSGAMAQFGGGFKVGLPLTDTFDIVNAPSGTRRYEAKTKRYIVGPQFELRFPAGVSVEFDALYTRMNFSSITGAATSIATATIDADAWEFPLLLKYKFGGASAGVGSVRPFVDGGVAFRRLTNISIAGRVLNAVNGGDPFELNDRNALGAVVGAGVEIRALFIRISPEVRFVRWGVESFRDAAQGLLRSNRNQGQLLVGISF